MTWRLVVAGDVINTDDMNQIIKALDGVAGYGQRVQLIQLNDPTNYALDVRNLDPGSGKGLRVRDASDNVIFAVDKNGISFTQNVTAYDVSVGETMVTPAGIFGEDISSVDTFTLLNTASTRNGEALGIGDMLLGLNTAGNHNVLWDYSTGMMYFREGVTPVVTIDVHGVVTLVGNLGITGDIVLPVGQELDIVGTKPANVGTTPGTAATRVLHTVAPDGGDTTITPTGVGGGGGAIALVSGSGGVASSATTDSTGGVGGAIELTGGMGGLADEIGIDHGGAGGGLTLQAGAGGAATVGTHQHGGVGGAVNLLAGDAGASSGIAVDGGAVEIQSGGPQGAGTSVVEIGTDHMTSLLVGNAGTVIGITGAMTHTGALNLTGLLTLVGNLGITGDIIAPAGNRVDIMGTNPGWVGTTPGTDAGLLLYVTAPSGGPTSIATTGVGGVGGRISMMGGGGGGAPNAVNASSGGLGGSVFLNAGPGGDVTAVDCTGVNHGGVGGGAGLTSGNGGGVTVGTHRHGGDGGTLWLQGGNAGAGAEDASGGMVYIDSGSVVGGGFSIIRLGYVNAKTIAIGNAGAVIGITGATTLTGATAFTGVTTHTGAFNLTGALTLVGNLGITGNVGIGTATPATLFHVKGISGTQALIDISAGQYTQLDIANAGTTRLSLGYDQTNTVGYFLDATGGLYIKAGNIGIGTTTPDAALEVLATTTQLRLTHTDATKFTTFTVDTNHDLTVKPSSTGQIILQPTTDSVDFFQVLDVDGSVPVLNVNTITERVGIGTATPEMPFHVAGGSYLGRSSVPADKWIYVANNVIEGWVNNATVYFRTDLILNPTSGNVGIGTATPNANAILDIVSTTKAFMPPRMTTAERDLIAGPTEGMVVYNTTTHALNFHNGGAWAAV